MRIKPDYTLAGCCRPTPGDAITGYYSHERFIKVHKIGCSNLRKAEAGRLIALDWKEVMDRADYAPDEDFRGLDELDFRILRHHRDLGVDYSLMVASALRIEPEEVFQRHARLRAMDLLERVLPAMIRYRRHIVKDKWIKHRNHTYYDLSEKGRKYLEFYLAS